MGNTQARSIKCTKVFPHRRYSHVTNNAQSGIFNSTYKLFVKKDYFQGLYPLK